MARVSKPKPQPKPKPFKLKWPTTKAESDRLRAFKRENYARHIPAEDWLARKLDTTAYHWTRQALWGYRIFDFWSHQLGIAVEVDGDTHDSAWDAKRDAYNFKRSGIVVLRVANFNEDQAQQALDTIAHADSWNERRTAMGLKRVLRADKPPVIQEAERMQRDYAATVAS